MNFVRDVDTETRGGDPLRTPQPAHNRHLPLSRPITDAVLIGAAWHASTGWLGRSTPGWEYGELLPRNRAWLHGGKCVHDSAGTIQGKRVVLVPTGQNQGLVGEFRDRESKLLPSSFGRFHCIHRFRHYKNDPKAGAGVMHARGVE